MDGIHDLRSALKYLNRAGYRVAEVRQPIDPEIELVEHYLTTYQRPHGSWIADEQPLVTYRKPTRGNFPVLMGMFGSRQQCRHFLDPRCLEAADVSEAQLLMRAARAPIVPHTLEGPATSRTVIAAPDLLSELPVLRYAGDDPGPTVTLGLVYAWDSRTGRGNCSFHRITFKPCSIVVGIDSGGHLQRMIDTHTARGEHLPISVNIGLDPAIYIASVLTRPGVDYGYDELGAAGAIRGRSVNVAPCLTGRGRFIDHAEIVIEGSLGTAREPESPQPQGMSMPEYLGYRSPCGMAAVFEVQALSYRPGALYQTLSGPGFEQSALLGLGQECSVFAKLMAWQRTDLIRTVVAQPSGGGHLLTVLQVTKRSASDDEDVISLAKALLEAVSSLKNLLLVDEDVDPHSATEILWAMSTRARLDQDIHVTGPLPGNMLDPTQSAGYAPQDCDGFTKKSIIDCTVPYLQRRRFQRAFELRSAPSLPPV